jgi:hypothetical protein
MAERLVRAIDVEAFRVEVSADPCEDLVVLGLVWIGERNDQAGVAWWAAAAAVRRVRRLAARTLVRRTIIGEI